MQSPAVEVAVERGEQSGVARGRSRSAGRLHRVRRPSYAAFASVGLALLTFVVHDVGYLLHAPYWNDEVWVAVSTKVPLHDVPAVIASSPIGWDLLLRLAPAAHPQAARLIPLGFAVLAVLAAYWWIRSLPWRTAGTARLTATAAGMIALLSPSSLIRNDLKQYTCDAFSVLVVLWLTSRAERNRSWRSLVALVASGSLLFLFANPAALALGAGLASLGVVALIRGDRAAARRVLTVGSAGLSMVIAEYVAFYARGNVGGLRTYWATNFPPLGDGPIAVWHWFWGVAPSWFHVVGIGPVYIAIPALAIGAVAIARLGLPVTAISVPMLFAELSFLAGLKQYPIFDARTSHFIAIPVAVVGMVGLVTIILRIRPGRIGAIVAAITVGATAIWHGSSARQHDIPIQSTRQDVQTMQAGWRTGDVILTNTNGSWALAYYWGGRVGITPTSNTQQKFRAQSEYQPQMYYVCPEADFNAVPPQSCFVPETTTAALDRVRTLAGGSTRIWFELLQGPHGAKEAAIAWATAHGYAWRRPSGLRGSYLYLLIPCAAGAVAPQDRTTCEASRSGRVPSPPVISK